MLITSTQANIVSKLAVTMFAAAPGGFKGYLDNLAASKSYDMEAIAIALSAEPGFVAMYSGTTAQKVATMMNNLAINTAPADVQAVAQAYLTEQVDAGVNLGKIYADAIAYMATDANFATAEATINAKVAVANSFTAGFGAGVTNLDILQAQIANVTANTDTSNLVTAHLTTGADILFGTAANDIFMANLSANANTLQSGDYINGGAGTDKLIVTLANTPFAIAPITESIEIVEVRSQANGDDEGTNDVSALGINTIDAGDMNGVVQFWSVNSRDDLKIEDIQTDSHQTTIGMRSTDSGAVDYFTYFQNITAPDGSTAGSQLFLQVLDLDGGTANPLQENVYVGVVITVDGEEVTFAAENPIKTSYTDLAAALQAAVTQEGYDFNVTVGANFSRSDANGVQQTGQEIVITNNGSETLAAVGWTTGGLVVPADTNLYTSITDTPPATSENLTQVNVYLDDAGRGSQTGDLVAGNMSTGGPSNSPGIQQFNVTVNRDSWLDGMFTTNNSMEVINITSDGDATGNLRIDNLQADLDLIQTNGFNGNLRLSTTNLDALAAGTMTGDANFTGTYNNFETSSIMTGAGDDTITVTQTGTSPSGSTDTQTEINAGNGDNTVTYTLGSDNAATVTTGSGDDTVTGHGTDLTVNTGAGNDTIYAENTGTKAVAQLNANGTLNVVSGDISNDGNGVTPLLTELLFGRTVQVTLAIPGYEADDFTSGFEATAAIAASNGFLTTERDLYQAAANAINNNQVLNKLAEAEVDSNGNLVVTYLVDGLGTIGDEKVEIEVLGNWASLNATQQNSVVNALKAEYQDSSITAALVAAEFNTVNGVFDYALTTVTGSDSLALGGVNTVNAGTGNDVIVLSSDIATIDTVVFSAGNFGTNTIVHFNSATGGDVLDFTAWLDNVTDVSSTAGSESNVRIATTEAVNIATITENSVAITDFATLNGATVAALTFNGMTDAQVLTALNENATFANTATAGGFVGAVQKSILMVENNANEGQFKVYQVTSTTAANDNNFTAATLVGTVDFGIALDASFDATNLA